MDFEKFKYHSIINDELGLRIVWNRGKEFFDFDVTQSLAEKSRKSDKDALEVMFYLENKRWPKEGELENYNKTDVKRHVGDDFVIYEEDGEYDKVIREIKNLPADKIDKGLIYVLGRAYMYSGDFKNALNTYLSFLEKAKEAQATATSGGISDNDTIPAGTSVVFSGAIANSTTYKEFRQTNAYKTIATNYVGFNATNAEIKACLEWLIQKGKEGYQALPSTEEYRSAFGR